jgi:hypothetical protein
MSAVCASAAPATSLVHAQTMSSGLAMRLPVALRRGGFEKAATTVIASARSRGRSQRNENPPASDWPTRSRVVKRSSGPLTVRSRSAAKRRGVSGAKVQRPPPPAVGSQRAPAKQERDASTPGEHSPVTAWHTFFGSPSRSIAQMRLGSHSDSSMQDCPARRRPHGLPSVGALAPASRPPPRLAASSMPVQPRPKTPSAATRASGRRVREGGFIVRVPGRVRG